MVPSRGSVPTRASLFKARARLPQASLRSGLCQLPPSGGVWDNKGENAPLGGGGELGLVSELTAGSPRQVNFLLTNSGNEQRARFSGEKPEQTRLHRAVHSPVHSAPSMTAGFITHTAVPAHSWVPFPPLTPALPGQLCAPEATQRLYAALWPPAPPPRACRPAHLGSQSFGGAWGIRLVGSERGAGGQRGHTGGRGGGNTEIGV